MLDPPLCDETSSFLFRCELLVLFSVGMTSAKLRVLKCCGSVEFGPNALSMGVARGNTRTPQLENLKIKQA